MGPPLLPSEIFTYIIPLFFFYSSSSLISSMNFYSGVLPSIPSFFIVSNYMSGFLAKGRYSCLIGLPACCRSFSSSYSVSCSSNFLSQLIQAKSDWKSKQEHDLHLKGATALCSSWVCLQMHEARQVLISNPFRRGIHHYPSSSGRRGMNLKSLQGQVEQLVLNLP
jgi:hypothetical protein